MIITVILVAAGSLSALGPELSPHTAPRLLPSTGATFKFLPCPAGHICKKNSAEITDASNFRTQISPDQLD
jgi:hypothetical protein